VIALITNGCSRAAQGVTPKVQRGAASGGGDEGGAKLLGVLAPVAPHPGH
jgi:hypothetical protein